MVKYSIILATTLCIPYTLKPMELEDKYTVPQEIITHKKIVYNLYSTTHTFLSDFYPQNQETINPLVNIIDQMNNLQLASPPVDARNIGFYIFKRDPQLQLADSVKKSFFGNQLDKNHVSLIFARIATYNQELATKQYVSPNTTQIAQHLKNEKTNTTVKKLHTANIPIAPNTIRDKTIEIPSSVGIEEFMVLTNNIKEILQFLPSDAKRSAKLAYHQELLDCQKQTSS